MPDERESEPEGLLFSSPFYLLTTNQECYLCGQSNPVAAIATLNLDIPDDPDFKEINKGEGFLLSYVDWLPEDLMAQVLERHPNFQMDFSVTAGEEYFMSTCPCGGHYGDHYVHQKILDTAFRTPNALLVERLPFEGIFQSDAGYSQSDSISHLIQNKVGDFCAS